MSEPEMSIRVELSMPPDVGTDWAWRDVGEFVDAEAPIVLRQAAYNPSGDGLHYPPPPRRWKAWAERPDGTWRLVTGQSRRRWWMFWRRRVQ